MTDHADRPSRKAALIAGLGYLGMLPPAIFGQFAVFQGLVVPGDAAATVSNIQANELLVRFSIVGWLIVLICDVLVAWALYQFLKPANRSLSLLTAWFRIVYTTIHGMALLTLVMVLVLLGGDGYVSAFATEQVNALVLLLLDGRNYGFLIGLVFFGVHLLLLGAVTFRSGYVPKILGILLMLAGLGYLADSLAHILLPNYAAYAAIFTVIAALPSTVAELSLCVWLLLQGLTMRWGRRPHSSPAAGSQS